MIKGYLWNPFTHDKWTRETKTWVLLVIGLNENWRVIRGRINQISLDTTRNLPFSNGRNRW